MATDTEEYGEATGKTQGLCETAEYRYYPGPGYIQGLSDVMNAHNDLSMKTDDVLRVELEVFRREHRDLDEAIRAMQAASTADQLTLQRLKKKKLVLKDRIAQIEDRLLPDIIA